MRSAYREELQSLAIDLIHMSDHVTDMMDVASDALLKADLDKAEQVLESIDKVEDLRRKAESSAFSLLALESPVASDLRRIVAGLHIIDDFARMGALAVHIANIARRRHPINAVPEDIRGYITEMERLASDNCQKLKKILRNPDVECALQLALDDDAIDDIHHHLFQLTTTRPWKHSVREAVDTTQISRFLERFSDHAVEIAGQVVYMVTGMYPEEYQASQRTEEKNREIKLQFDEISRRYADPWD